MFVKMGFLNLFRQKRRTGITLAVITVGIGSLLLAMGHSSYIRWALRESTIHSETGHLQIFDGNYGEDEETILEHGLQDPEALRRELTSWQGVQTITARIDLMGLISNGEKSVACIGQGVEPEKEKAMRSMVGMTGAAYDSLCGTDEYSVVLGRRLARSLRVRKGDWVTLMTNTTDGALNAMDLRVAGTVTGFAAEYESRVAIIPLTTVQALLNTRKVKHLLLTLDRTGSTGMMIGKLEEWAKENGKSLRFRSWSQEAAYYNQVSRFYDQMTGFLTVVLILIVFFSASNTVVMSILERTREIGTALSIGTSRLQTVRLFLYEGIGIGILGGLLSVGFGLILSLLINHWGVVLPPAPGSAEGYPLRIRIETDSYAAVYVLTVLMTALSSLIPAFRAGRMKIVDALGHV